MSVSTKEVLTDYKNAMIELRNERMIDAIKNCKTRDEAIHIYKDAIIMLGIEWSKFNNAIIEKWSISGLKYIKHNAWKLLQQS